MGLTATWLCALVGGMVEVEGNSRCPTAVEVAAALLPLLPKQGAPGAPDRAFVDEIEGAIEVRLVGAEGRLLGRRRLEAGAPCGELAGGAAVVIATWESELRPGTRIPFELSRPPPPPVLNPRSPLRWDIAGGFYGSFDGVAPAGGGYLEGALGRGSLAVRLGAIGQTSRSAPLGSGRVRWDRPSLFLGARYRVRLGRLRMDLHAELVGGLLILTGEGFSPSTQAFDFDPGGGGGIRASIAFGRFALEIGAGLIGWFRPQTAQVMAAEPTPTYTLPRLEGHVTVGLAVGNRGPQIVETPGRPPPLIQ